MTDRPDADPASQTAGEVAAVVIDVPRQRFEPTVAFWADALAATPEVVPGLPGGADRYVRLAGAASVTDVLVQRLEDGRAGYHLDVAVPDRTRAVAAAVAAGGRVTQHHDGWDVLEDPAGLSCCVGFEGTGPPRLGPPPADRGYLDAVFVDVTADRVDPEVAFWSHLLGAHVVPPTKPGSPYRFLAGVHAVGGAPLTVQVQAVGADPGRDGDAVPPRLHVDLSAVDLAAEAARLERAGARQVAVVEWWITLADPAGNLLCVVPREDDTADGTGPL